MAHEGCDGLNYDSLPFLKQYVSGLARCSLSAKPDGSILISKTLHSGEKN